MSPPIKSPAQWTSESKRHLDEGNFDAAMSCATRATEIDPGFAAGWYFRGLALMRAGRYEDGAEAFRRTLSLDGGSAHATNGLAVCLSHTGRLSEAITLCATCRDQTHFYLRNTHTHLLKESGDIAGALALQLESEALARSDGEKGSWWYNRACFEALSGRREDALASLEKAIALAPKFRASAPRDPDFAALLTDPTFRALTS